MLALNDLVITTITSTAIGLVTDKPCSLLVHSCYSRVS